MRILVIGAGATGGYFGGRLVEAGRDITFLVRESRAMQLRAHGLQLRSPHGDATLHPELLTAAQLRRAPRPFDLILVSTKAYSLAAAMDDFAPAVGVNTVILPLLNGMRHLDTLAARFGEDRVLGGSCRIVADLGPEGQVEQKTSLGELIYGERSSGDNAERQHAIHCTPKPSSQIDCVDRELRVPGFDATLSPDILASMWQKWWILASLGSICVLARGTIGQVAVAPNGPQVAQAIIHECTSIATANGYPADPPMLADHIARMTERGSALTSSMYRDMSKGAPVEADHVLGDLLARAGQLSTPLLTAAYVQLKVYEAARTDSY